MSVITRVPPVSKEEFLLMFRKSVPPTGWGPKIAVANSGGSDSTCLLFLLKRCLSDESNRELDLPRSVVSITVDHDLQASSSAMANHCSDIAASMGVFHHTTRITWSEPPYPPKPDPGQMFENVARTARYHTLFEIMTRIDVKMLAFGHHADDQVETSLMRLARGTTEIGAGGMRRCRRWGMGMGKGEGSLGWAGYEGMRRWILRPLLDVSKDRILATCEANGIEYVNDPTNFQPEVTLRNAVRRILDEEGGSRNEFKPASPLITNPDISEKLKSMKQAVQSLRTISVDVTDGREQLRGAVKFLTQRVDDIDGQVDSQLNRRRLKSPPGTFLLSSHDLSSVQDPIVRTGMILRIMRYVSFHPWGSLRADGNRRQASLERIIVKIWSPWSFNDNIFVAGGGVMWTPVVLRDGEIKSPHQYRGGISGENFGWMASRQPPLDKQTREGRHNPTRVDITEKLKTALREGDDEVEVLYDCRFLVRLNVAKMPDNVAASLLKVQGGGTILIQHFSRWFLPKVVWRLPMGKEEGEVILESVKLDADNGENKIKSFLEMLQQAAPRDITDEVFGNVERGPERWISIEWIRSMAPI